MKLSTEPTYDPAIEHYVERFQQVMDADIQGDHDGGLKAVQIYRMHKTLLRNDSLYVQVADTLAERGILSRAALKDCVRVGKELCGD